MSKLPAFVIVAWLCACSGPSHDRGPKEQSAAPAREHEHEREREPTAAAHELEVPVTASPALSEHVPTPEDFEDEATRTIDRTNYRAKLGEMYQLISRDAERLGLTVARSK